MSQVNAVWYAVVTDGSALKEPRLRAAVHPFFRGLDRGFVEAVSRGSVDAIYRRGEHLFREGQPADRFIVLYHGAVALELPDPPASPRADEVIGWPALLDPYLWPFDARALQETRVVELDAATLRGTLESQPTEAARLLGRLLPRVGRHIQLTYHLVRASTGP